MPILFYFNLFYIQKTVFAKFTYSYGNFFTHLSSSFYLLHCNVFLLLNAIYMLMINSFNRVL